MSDIVSEIRFALRNALFLEDVQKQSTIFFTVIPGAKPKWASAPSETYLRIFGLDRALSRGNEGFLGREWFCPQHQNVVVSDRAYLGKDESGNPPQTKCPTCQSPLQERPRRPAGWKPGDPEELGAWHVVGLPDQTPTGYKGKGSKFPGPEPWVVFMDWMWDFLKSKDLNPTAYQGFGDLEKPYNRLTPNQKRQRKYGKIFKPQMEPGEVLPSALRSLSSTANWPRGFDIEKDITIILDSIGRDQEEVTRNFQKLLASAPMPNFMRLVPDTEEHRWFVSFDYETDDQPEKYEQRRQAIDTYKKENREKWIAAIQKLSGGRTNPAQLAPLVRAWLVAKHGFQRPFHVDVLSQEEFDRAVAIINGAHLDELVDYAKEAGVLPPSVGSDSATVNKARQEAIMAKRWVQIINRLADEGGVEPALVEVALANYLVQQKDPKTGGSLFDDPFEFDIASPATQAKAITAVGTLTFDDIRSLLESVQMQVRSLMG